MIEVKDFFKKGIFQKVSDKTSYYKELQVDSTFNIYLKIMDKFYLVGNYEV